MKVYVVTIGWDYEGEQILGVYSTREAAQERAQSVRGEKRRTCDWADVTEWEVDNDAAEPVDCG